MNYSDRRLKMHDFNVTHHHTNSVFIYEPDQEELLNEIVPRFTALQIYQAILSAQASEHAARMVAMRNATESANDLIGALQLEYNKLRQQLITNEMLDITGGAEALAKEVMSELSPSRAITIWRIGLWIDNILDVWCRFRAVWWM